MGNFVTKVGHSLSERKLLVSRMRQLGYEEKLNPRVRWLRYYFFSFIVLIAVKAYQHDEESVLVDEYKSFIRERGRR